MLVKFSFVIKGKILHDLHIFFFHAMLKFHTWFDLSPLLTMFLSLAFQALLSIVYVGCYISLIQGDQYLKVFLFFGKVSLNLSFSVGLPFPGVISTSVALLGVLLTSEVLVGVGHAINA